MTAVARCKDITPARLLDLVSGQLQPFGTNSGHLWGGANCDRGLSAAWLSPTVEMPGLATSGMNERFAGADLWGRVHHGTYSHYRRERLYW